MAEQERKLETTQGKALFVAKEYKTIKQDLTVVKGIIQRQAKQIDILDGKVVDVTARSMSLNMMISGIVESKGENYKLCGSIAKGLTRNKKHFISVALCLAGHDKLNTSISCSVGRSVQNL